jgi:hypothetical protein
MSASGYIRSRVFVGCALFAASVAQAQAVNSEVNAVNRMEILQQLHTEIDAKISEQLKSADAEKRLQAILAMKEAYKRSIELANAIDSLNGSLKDEATRSQSELLKQKLNNPTDPLLGFNLADRFRAEITRLITEKPVKKKGNKSELGRAVSVAVATAEAIINATKEIVPVSQVIANTLSGLAALSSVSGDFYNGYKSETIFSLDDLKKLTENLNETISYYSELGRANENSLASAKSIMIACDANKHSIELLKADLASIIGKGKIPESDSPEIDEYFKGLEERSKKPTYDPLKSGQKIAQKIYFHSSLIKSNVEKVISTVDNFDPLEAEHNKRIAEVVIKSKKLGASDDAIKAVVQQITMPLSNFSQKNQDRLAKIKNLLLDSQPTNVALAD